MKKMSVIGATLLGAAVLCAAPLSLNLFQDKGTSLSVDKAQARIGHPLTPGSIAGVHRRVERRAYRRGYYGGGYYGGGYYGQAFLSQSHQRLPSLGKSPGTDWSPAKMPGFLPLISPRTALAGI